ncbi:MAG: glutamine synthetase III [Oscillospiraceae bacterium]|nr:glutamine synthetase III [Oscillospiraceae bacterium]
MSITDIFGSNVFSVSIMRQRLPREAFEEVMEVMEHGGQISMATADIVAGAMKDWAVEKGATHYTHWFQPLTGSTAEKHDSFITYPKEGITVLRLSGKQLIRGESDASSFPSGGLRATSYARGYTAWDITSPVFVRESGCGVILCIPTIFISYTGEALDKKTPLLRSLEALSSQALRILRLFGNTTSSKVTAYVGPEQEYFLVDRAKYLKRKDLVYAGRTLFGAPAPKGQELDDHYFGQIRERVGAYMKDLNNELWKLGITAITQHNEAAPAQHEMAPIYATANVAVDQNQLTMETMKRVATKHDLVCLLNEKPYAGINGSGKHNNWSVGTDDGINLFDPGDDPASNLQFMLVLACVLAAVDDRADVLRESAACVGNDHRLGAQEAPPAIISIFLGSQLTDIVDRIVSGGSGEEENAEENLITGVSTLPMLKKDTSDRNRTSPFAFTGNRFEFRMVGASDSVASSTTAMNACLAEAFCNAADALEGAEDFEAACRKYIRRMLKRHYRIIFNGDGYSEEWVLEAARRGLPNIGNMVDAVQVLTKSDVVAMYEKFHVFSRTELVSRMDVQYETYAKHINIEANVMIHMASKAYIPAVVSYSGDLARTVASLESIGMDASVQRELLDQVNRLLKDASAALATLEHHLPQVHAMTSLKAMAEAYRDVIVPCMTALRTPIDKLELLVHQDVWPMYSYGDLLFEV